MTAAPSLDRREQGRGDRRRESLLSALRDLLREGEAWESITVAQITERAGVTRSGFYFYFPNLAMAVVAAAEGLFDVAQAANVALADTSVAPAARIRSALGDLFDRVGDEQAIYGAALAARTADPALRELWDAARIDYTATISELITSERATGNAPDGVDPNALAGTLLALNEHGLELFARGAVTDRAAQLDVLVTIWLRSIYGTDPAPSRSGEIEREDA